MQKNAEETLTWHQENNQNIKRHGDRKEPGVFLKYQAQAQGAQERNEPSQNCPWAVRVHIIF